MLRWRGRLVEQPWRRSGTSPGQAAVVQFRSHDRERLRNAPQLLLTAVLTIIAWQSVEVSESFARYWNSPLWIFPYVAWPMLFFLTGFAMAGVTISLPRLARGVLVAAIGPLILAVVSADFILGPSITALTPGSYFRDIDTWIYLLNLVGVPQFALPGVFEFNNLVAVVNEPVWALPCLAATVCVACSDRLIGRWRRALAALVATVTVAVGVANWLGALSSTDRLVALALAATLTGQIGVLAFEYRRHFNTGRVLLIGSLAFLAALAYLGRGGRWTDPLPLQLIAATVGVALLGVSQLRLPFERLSLAMEPFVGALLLTAFPLQQLVASSRMAPQDALSNLLISAPLIGATSFVFVWLSTKLARLAMPDAGDAFEMRLPTVPNPSAWLKRRGRLFRPFALLFTVLIVTTLCVLAMTLFALQRNPWEN